MLTIPAIIDDLLHGPTVISNETGIPLTTIHSWKRSGRIPAWRVQALIELAERKGVALSQADFPADRAVA